MNALWILLTCAVSAGIIIGTERLVSRLQFSRAWRIAFWTLSAAGFGLGVWLVCLRYLKTPTLRLYGFPFPIAGGEFMNGRWADGLVGNPLALVADVGGAVAACVLPLAAAALIAGRRRGENVESNSIA